MQQNVGTLDRTVRLFVGPILLVVAVAGLTSVVSLGLAPVAASLAVGVILTVTGALQTCPLYRLFGVSTCAVPGGP